MGAVHKVCHAPEGGGGLRKCDSLWQGEGGKENVTSHFKFFTIHNFMFYFIFYHILYKFKLQLLPSKL